MSDHVFVFDASIFPLDQVLVLDVSIFPLDHVFVLGVSIFPLDHVFVFDVSIVPLFLRYFSVGLWYCSDSVFKLQFNFYFKNSSM